MDEWVGRSADDWIDGEVGWYTVVSRKMDT